jgi:hypothetical protein
MMAKTLSRKSLPAHIAYFYRLRCICTYIQGGIQLFKMLLANAHIRYGTGFRRGRNPSLIKNPMFLVNAALTRANSLEPDTVDGATGLTISPPLSSICSSGQRQCFSPASSTSRRSIFHHSLEPSGLRTYPKPSLRMLQKSRISIPSVIFTVLHGSSCSAKTWFSISSVTLATSEMKSQPAS